MAQDEEEASRPATTAPSSREPAPAAMAVSSAEQIEQAADEVENRNKADDRHMAAPRFASATPPPTSRGPEATERLRPAARRVGREGVSTGGSRWTPGHYKNNNQLHTLTQSN